jgi:hypothetical protein
MNQDGEEAKSDQSKEVILHRACASFLAVSVQDLYLISLYLAMEMCSTILEFYEQVH